MTRTMEKPDQPGWYWYKEPGEDRQMVFIEFQESGDFTVFFPEMLAGVACDTWVDCGTVIGYMACRKYLKDLHGQWCRVEMADEVAV